jgi:hypothetical protein
MLSAGCSSLRWRKHFDSGTFSEADSLDCRVVFANRGFSDAASSTVITIRFEHGENPQPATQTELHQQWQLRKQAGTSCLAPRDLLKCTAGCDGAVSRWNLQFQQAQEWDVRTSWRRCQVVLTSLVGSRTNNRRWEMYGVRSEQVFLRMNG